MNSNFKRLLGSANKVLNSLIDSMMLIANWCMISHDPNLTMDFGMGNWLPMPLADLAYECHSCIIWQDGNLKLIRGGAMTTLGSEDQCRCRVASLAYSNLYHTRPANQIALEPLHVLDMSIPSFTMEDMMFGKSLSTSSNQMASKVVATLSKTLSSSPTPITQPILSSECCFTASAYDSIMGNLEDLKNDISDIEMQSRFLSSIIMLTACAFMDYGLRPEQLILVLWS